MVEPDVDVSEAFVYSRDDELCSAADVRFILANIELPVVGGDDPFVWTCWFSLSEASFERMDRLWEEPGREEQEPAFGWLSSALPTYVPSTIGLKARVHTRPVGERPWVELEPTQHPLAVEQRDGIPPERIIAVYHAAN